MGSQYQAIRSVRLTTRSIVSNLIWRLLLSLFSDQPKNDQDDTNTDRRS